MFVKTVFAILKSLLGRERNHVFTVSMCLPGFAFVSHLRFVSGNADDAEYTDERRLIYFLVQIGGALYFP